jgi:drug/metabolite transporter (DMT)-like permease
MIVTAAVLAAAVTHALWNAIVKGVEDRVEVVAVMDLTGMAAAAVLAAVVPAPAAGSWGYLATSALLHVFYKAFLLSSYRVGDLGQVYPLARGLSPLVVTAVAAVIAGEVPTVAQLIGIALISVGLFSLVGRVKDRRPVAFAVGTGLFIAAYTLTDGLGVRQAETALGYIAWLFLLDGFAIPAYLSARRPDAVRRLRSSLAAGATAGALSVLAYGLVIWAQTRGALAPIAALRETSVIVAAVIGTVVFHEPFGRRRIAAAVVVALGVALLVRT